MVVSARAGDRRLPILAYSFFDIDLVGVVLLLVLSAIVTFSTNGLFLVLFGAPFEFERLVLRQQLLIQRLAVGQRAFAVEPARQPRWFRYLTLRLLQPLEERHR